MGPTGPLGRLVLQFNVILDWAGVSPCGAPAPSQLGVILSNNIVTPEGQYPLVPEKIVPAPVWWLQENNLNLQPRRYRLGGQSQVGETCEQPGFVLVPAGSPGRLSPGGYDLGIEHILKERRNLLGLAAGGEYNTAPCSPWCEMLLCII